MQTRILLLLLFVALAYSSTFYYYVSPSGVDNSLCNAANPCQTIAHCLTLGPSGSDISVTLNSTAGSYGSENCGVMWSTDTYPTVTITGSAETLGGAVINCGASSRHFWFSGLPKTNITLSYLTLHNGNSSNGGCVYASFSNVRRMAINNVQFSNCVGENGGALYTDSLTNIESSIFTNNNAYTDGGAVYVQSLVNGSSINSSSIKFNTAGAGAGIYLVGTYLTVTNSLISSNSASTYGGGLYITSPTPKDSGNYNFMGSNFTYNNATLQGAGVYAANLNHSWNIFGALFTDNWSSSLSGDSNIACNPSAMQFCYACTAKDCVTGCGISSAQSCSQNSTNTKSVLCYGTQFTMCKDPGCTCKTKMSKTETILIVVICLLLVIGVVLITVDVVRYLLKKRQQESAYTPIK